MRSTLRTRVLRRDPQGFVDVAWCLSARNYGSYRIDVQQEAGVTPQEQAVVAELVVLRHLVSSDSSPIEHWYTSNTLQLSVSKGAIRRLLRKQSRMTGAYPYAGFLRTRFQGTPISIDKDFDFWNQNEIPHYGGIEPVALPITDDLRNPYYTAFIAGLGDVDITEHAIDRYEELHLQSSTGTEAGSRMKSPYHSMMRRLKNPELAKYEIPGHAQLKKTVKYNGTDREEYWRHPDAGEVFVIVKNTLTGRKTLVTVATPGARRLAQQIRVGGKSVE